MEKQKQNKKCVCRESNPGLLLGRVYCLEGNYPNRWTTNACLRNFRASLIHKLLCQFWGKICDKINNFIELQHAYSWCLCLLQHKLCMFALSQQCGWMSAASLFELSIFWTIWWQPLGLWHPAVLQMTNSTTLFMEIIILMSWSIGVSRRLDGKKWF